MNSDQIKCHQYSSHVVTQFDKLLWYFFFVSIIVFFKENSLYDEEHLQMEGWTFFVFYIKEKNV